MGGATLGHALANQGRSVLFLERGHDLSAPEAIRGVPAEASTEYQSINTEERMRVLARSGRSAESIQDALARDTFVPFIGCGTGGSSSLYGMVLERLFPRDFSQWPLSYEQMAPWYRRAEALYGVTGTVDAMRSADDASLGVPEPPGELSDANAVVFAHLRRRGLHPYRVHTACRRLPDCRMCQGYLCPQGTCKNDARTTCLLPALARPEVQLLASARVMRLDAEGRRVAAVRAVVSGQEQTFHAKVIVLAAGALMTPRLLLESGNLANSSGLVGRRLMRHLIDLYVLAMAPRVERASEAKELGLNDFYVEGDRATGNVQSFGMAPTLDYLRQRPGPNMWKLLGPLAVPIARLFAAAPIVASIAEDEPSSGNSVAINGSRLQLTYRPGARDLERRRRLRRRVHRAFARFGAIRVVGTSSREGLGHVCGTTTMGEDATRSVVDPFNRAHDLDNLYVVDGSFFPTSGAMNPALTIAANALRVAQHLDSVL